MTKLSVSLDEAEIKEAIIRYVKEKMGVTMKSVYISYYDAKVDPRERSSYSASASE